MGIIGIFVYTVQCTVYNIPGWRNIGSIHLNTRVTAQQGR
jgi:hypothetical protein